MLAQAVASHVGLLDRPDEGQYELLARLRNRGILPREMWQIFDEVRRTENAANHAFSEDHRTALTTMKQAWQIGVWFHRTFKAPKAEFVLKSDNGVKATGIGKLRRNLTWKALRKCSEPKASKTPSQFMLCPSLSVHSWLKSTDATYDTRYHLQVLLEK